MNASEGSRIATNPFVYDASDLRALNRQVVRWSALLLSIVLFGVVVWFFVSVMVEMGEVDWIFVGLVCLVALLFAGPWTWRPFLEHRSMRRQGILEPMIIMIEPEQFTVSSEQADSRIRWSGVTRVQRRGTRLFLFSSKKVAHIIPRRAFDSEEQFERFVEAAGHYWKQRHRL